MAANRRQMSGMAPTEYWLVQARGRPEGQTEGKGRKLEAAAADTASSSSSSIGGHRRDGCREGGGAAAVEIGSTGRQGCPRPRRGTGSPKYKTALASVVGGRHRTYPPPRRTEPRVAAHARPRTAFIDDGSAPPLSASSLIRARVGRMLAVRQTRDRATNGVTTVPFDAAAVAHFSTLSLPAHSLGRRRCRRHTLVHPVVAGTAGRGEPIARPNDGNTGRWNLLWRMIAEKALRPPCRLLLSFFYSLLQRARLRVGPFFCKHGPSAVR